MLVKDMLILVGGKPMFITGLDQTIFNFEVFCFKLFSLNGFSGTATPVKLGLRDWRSTDNSAEGGSDKNGEGGETHDDL